MVLTKFYALIVERNIRDTSGHAEFPFVKCFDERPSEEQIEEFIKGLNEPDEDYWTVTNPYKVIATVEERYRTEIYS